MTSQHHKEACRPFDSLASPLCFEHKLTILKLELELVLSMFSNTNIQVDSTLKLQLTVDEA